jgi:hypothetical protein
MMGDIIPNVPDFGNYIYIIEWSMIVLPQPKILTSQPPLEMLQYGVGGNIELIPYFNNLYQRPCVAFCNEYGKQLMMKPNKLAQKLWEESLGRPILEDHLVGNIVIIVAEPSFLREM